MCPHTTTCVFIILYTCPHTIILHVLIPLYMCPHTTICVLILLYVSSYYYISVLMQLYVSSHHYMCPDTTIYLSSNYYICRLLLSMCPHTQATQPSALRGWRILLLYSDVYFFFTSALAASFLLFCFLEFYYFTPTLYCYFTPALLLLFLLYVPKFGNFTISNLVPLPHHHHRTSTHIQQSDRLRKREWPYLPTCNFPSLAGGGGSRTKK